ncbi:hypothetical protein HOD96_04265 [Candidatus Falkowbacteria bacterium]|jgi:inhibitor of cysteine peptidase|nr:hypothetical protein [Candidatus Falkowbacteria bacterium]MBT4433163.1 hypothetical protein [Candidatus Falkowbacteria bacterium]
MPEENFGQKIYLFNDSSIRIIAVSFAIILFSFVYLALTLDSNQPLVRRPVDRPIVFISNDIKDELAEQSKIKKFKDYDELKEFLENNTSESGGIYYGGFGGEMMMERSLDATESLSDIAQKSNIASDESGGGSDDFSTTNIQVEGVDEADIIKTDGKYVYALTGNDLFIIDAYPASGAQILSKIKFDSRPQDIYLNDDRLVVYGRDNTIYERDFYKNFKRRSAYAFLKVFDITDKVNPKQVRDLNFEGNLVNSRMIGDYVYFITSERAYYLADEMPVPRILESGQVINEKKIMDVYYIDIPHSSYNFTHIAAINVKDNKKEINSEAYLLGYGQNMYVSQDNIYITYTKHISEFRLIMEVMREFLFPRLSVKDQERIAEIEAVDNSILSQDEKMAKIGQIIERYIYSLSEKEQDILEEEMEQKMKEKYEDLSKELEKTVIHKIAINKGKIEYRRFGEVTGHVLNQFSMDENDGYFRIATTKSRTWSQFEDERMEPYNNLYVLDKNLKVVGKVEDLAKGERIYSVRFMQDRAYMVTFKQTDPLFVIDLKNPTKPKVLGELKIPGFSNYLHPYDKDTLIGLGKDTYENEFGRVTTKGLKLSLFDVSSMGDPKEIDTFMIGESGSSSYALNDHKAFLFSKDKNLLVIPATIREEGKSWNDYFRGALVFNINKKGFELKGKIRHLEGDDMNLILPQTPKIPEIGISLEEDIMISRVPYNKENFVKRSLYIDDVLYTFSDQFLMMNELDDLDEIKSLDFSKFKGGDDFEIIN